ncbi:hypothetical protein FOL47_010161 [Perkinsus chesapeaki]|uniref:Uncharacterized protein n=1 Tax=Perkinsus chesapeaki TaxID=330153 RepID=A0A7J6L4D1_PERCH|nr:hypothetical protein FOL47_010161 [Perkinsus chesapeaki]
MSGEGNPWEDLCEWVRSQGGSLANALGNLNNQGTYSDITSGDSDALQAASSSSSLMPVSPFGMFLMVMLFIWGYLYLQGRRNRALTEKPRNSRRGDREDKNDNGGGPPPATGGVY